MNLAERTALAGHVLFMENGPEILDSEQPEEDVLDQARLTADQDEELRHLCLLTTPP
jgi:hypothetical protein